MAGRPRRRLAAELRSAIVTMLRRTGHSATFDELVAAMGYGDELSPIERDAIGMARRELDRHPQVVVDDDGRLRYVPLALTNGHTELDEGFEHGETPR
jgi:hypothetical protein